MPPYPPCPPCPPCFRARQECHYAPTRGGAQDKYINDPDLLKQANVLVVLNSATPYNCLTTCSRIEGPDVHEACNPLELKPTDDEPQSNIVRWRPTEKGRYRSIDFYINSIAFRVPEGLRQLSLAVASGNEPMQTYSIELFGSTDRFGGMRPICEHVTEMLRSQQVPLKLGYDKKAARFYFLPTSKKTKFTVQLLGWDDGAPARSVLPLLGFERSICMDTAHELPQATKLYATKQTTIDDEHPMDAQRVRTDVKLADLQKRFEEKFGSRKSAKRKATVVGQLKEADKVTPICIQDGHLILCDYLFSLAYFALVRVNPLWHKPGQSMLLPLDESERRVNDETTDDLFASSAIPNKTVGQPSDRFKALLKELATGTPQTPSGGNDRKILASFDMTCILFDVVLAEAYKIIREADSDEQETKAAGGEVPIESRWRERDDAGTASEPLSDTDCLKRIFLEKLKGEKEASTTTDEHSQ